MPVYSLSGFQFSGELDLSVFMLKLLLDLFFSFIIIRRIFYPVYRDDNYLFTAVTVNISIFMLCYFLSGIKLENGLAFGLFAVLSIMRYRTEQIPIRHMSYMFAMIITGVLNALSGSTVGLIELICGNITITVVIYLLENVYNGKKNQVKRIRYEKIRLIRPECRDELLKDLCERTGLPVFRVEIDSVNFQNDTAEIRVFYHGV